MRFQICPTAALTAATSLCLSISSAWAQPHDDEIILTVTNDAIQTNTSEGPERLFVSHLGEVFPNFTDTPGFDSAPGTFDAGSRIGFNLQGPLRKWDGASFVHATTTEQMEIAFSSLIRITPSTATQVEGFTLAVGSNGQWHRHLEFTLLPPASDGLYLLELDLFSTLPNLLPSTSFWILFNQNAAPEQEIAAEAWVRTTLIGPSCPGDWDQDGDADSDDIILFFLEWESGEADIDADLDSDSDDIIHFFGSWDGGC